MIMRTSKAKHIADTLIRRIERGSYSSYLPGAPALAKEFGVTPVTIYNALDSLKNSGTVVQQKNGRLSPVSSCEKKQLRITYLASSGVYPFDRWLSAVRECAIKFGCDFKCVTWQFPDDPIVFNTLNSDDFDIIFIHSYSSLVTNPLLKARLHEISDKVVSLFYDDTANNVRMLDGYESEAMKVLVKYLKRNNCGQVGFFYSGTQHCDQRVMIAAKLLKKDNLLGDIHNVKLQPGMHSAQAAAISMAELLKNGAYRNDKVIFCGTVDITIGASLALREAGKKIPEDVSLVSFGNPELAALQNPPLTVISTPNPYSQVEKILKQYLGISAEPKRLKFTGTIPHNDEESIIYKGKSVKFNHN